MVRFGSNLKRPKTISRHVVNKEPALAINVTRSTYKSSENQQHQHQPQQIRQRHAVQNRANEPEHPSNTEISTVLMGLTSGQAIKKLIEEIDRLLKEQARKQKYTGIDQTVVLLVLRYLCILLLTIRSFSLRALNRPIGIFFGSLLLLEILFIEFVERRRKRNSITWAIEQIKNELKKLDKALLTGKTSLNSLYELVN